MSTRTQRRRASRIGPARLTRIADDELLRHRMCDLAIGLRGTMVEQCIEQLYRELSQRDIEFRPHYWLAEEWFSPDGVPGIAIPFYLAHKRLRRLEQKQMLEVEGGSREECMRILRHEAGHAIDTAYRLRRRRAFRDVFGPISQPYPEYYHPKPYSKSYVVHLDMWYAQAHPIEDFAETFAVWLRPRSRWRTQYKSWPALQKLEYVDTTMKELHGERPRVTCREEVSPIHTVRKTLRQHYRAKREHYGVDSPDFYDRDLRRLFSDDPEYATNPTAASFLRSARTEIRRTVARWTGEYQYTIEQVLRQMIQRCRDLRLRLKTSLDDALHDVVVLVTVQTMNYLHGGRHRVAL